jgi:hypothetical protein
MGFAKIISRSWTFLPKTSIDWRYISGWDSLKTLPLVGIKLEMPNSSLDLGHDLQKPTKWAKNMS